MGLVISMGLSLVFLTICLQSVWLMKGKLEVYQETILLQEEAAAFVHYIERELDGASEVQIGAGRILFSRGADRFDYRIQGDKVVRTKNSLGYVTVCFNVKDFILRRGTAGIEFNLVLQRNGVTVEIDSVLQSTVSTS